MAFLEEKTAISPKPSQKGLFEKNEIMTKICHPVAKRDKGVSLVTFPVLV